MSTAEAAAALDLSVSKVRALLDTGELPAIAVGGNIRIPRTAVEARTSGEARPAPAADTAMVEAILGCPLTDLPLLVDPAWLADKLGMSRKYVTAAMAAGDIPSVKAGSRWRCPAPALVRWLLDGRPAA